MFNNVKDYHKWLIIIIILSVTGFVTRLLFSYVVDMTFAAILIAVYMVDKKTKEELLKNA